MDARYQWRCDCGNGRVADRAQEVSALAIVALGGVRQIAKVLSLEIGVDQSAKSSGLGGLRLPRLVNRRDASAFCEKLSRPQRGLF